jgi:cell division protein FtsL
MKEQGNIPFEEKKKSAEGRKDSVVKKGFIRLFAGSYLEGEWAMRMIPYLLFLALLAVIYIYNIYTAEKKQSEINRLEVEVEELRFEHSAVKARVMGLSRHSVVAGKVEGLGLTQPGSPPPRIKLYTLDRP